MVRGRRGRRGRIKIKPQEIIQGLLICLFVAAMDRVQTAAEPVNILITQLWQIVKKNIFKIPLDIFLKLL